MVVDKPKFDMTVKAMRDGLPKLLALKARMEPIKEAAVYWAKTAKDARGHGPKIRAVVQGPGDVRRAAGRLAAKAAAHVQANVNVSVSVSASASGTVGG